MRLALAGGNHACHGSTGHSTRRLNQHLNIEAVGKTPLNLAHGISGKGEHDAHLGSGS